MTLREMLFADEATKACHSQEGLQRLINCLAHVCRKLNLTICLKKTKVYVESTISSSQSLEAEFSKRIGKAASTMGRLSKRIWENNKLTTTPRSRFTMLVCRDLYSMEAKRRHPTHDRNVVLIASIYAA